MTLGILIFSAIVSYFFLRYKAVRFITLVLFTVVIIGFGLISFYAWTDYDFWPPFALWVVSFFVVYIPFLIVMIDNIWELSLKYHEDAPQ